MTSEIDDTADSVKGVQQNLRLLYDAVQELQASVIELFAQFRALRHAVEEEMAALDRAHGPEFDRLFLIGMIHHHQGAIDMVDVLFKSYGAAQDETVFKFASDVYADQSIEIDRMMLMLNDGGASH